MSLTGLITFIAGTKAKSSEVNANFNLVKSFVDNLESDIATNTADIETLDTGKANVNGNASNRFAVADAVNDFDAMNKETVFKYIHNSMRYINGLNITRTASNTIAITAGSAMDSTFTHIMVLNSATSVTNSSQALSGTYYVYLISKEDGTTEVIISTEAVTPSLPSGYLYYRQIGKYFTYTATNDIAMVVNVNEYTRDKYDYANAHDYDNLGGTNDKDTTRTAETDGLLYIEGVNTFTASGFTVNSVSFVIHISSSQGSVAGGFMPISKGQTYSYFGGDVWKFIPKVKYTI